jgi:hypothetical protein
VETSSALAEHGCRLRIWVRQDAVISSGIREANEAALREPDGEKAVRLVAAAGSRLFSLEAELVRLLSAEVAADFARISNQHRLQDLTKLATSSAGVAFRFPGKEDARRAAVAAWAVSGIETYDRLVLQAGWNPRGVRTMAGRHVHPDAATGPDQALALASRCLAASRASRTSPSNSLLYLENRGG